ncbi:MAG: metallophosphoesterase [Janthinobacterium lividum]
MNTSMPPSLIRVQILSDIHAEHGAHALPRPGEIDTGADIVLIAGDLASAPDSVKLAARLFPCAPALVLIGGNHEHYGTGLTIDDGLDSMWRAASEVSARGNRTIAVLEDASTVLDIRSTAVRVLGSTLWTDYGLRHRAIIDAEICERSINDHRMIRGHDGVRFTAREAASRHQASRAFLGEVLAQHHDGPTIVVTHHLPSMRSVAGRFRREPTSSGFASHADDLVGMGAALWVHGHTHDSMTWEDGSGTLVVCNPAGYARPDGSRENAAFNPHLCIEIRESNGAWRAKIEPRASA